jgi:cell wall-associated NlpC family hydrolase
MKYGYRFILVLLFASCSLLPEKKQQVDTVANTKIIDTPVINYADTSNPLYINTGNTKPLEIVEYAENFIGTPYVYASTNPSVGFDCSGFITHVFNHFNITVPRSSVNFTHVPHEIPVEEAKPADLILFTGTDSTIRVVGHMGIIVYNANDELLFIHATSGKKMGVTITPLNEYYKGRFVKVIRVFPQNGS